MTANALEALRSVRDEQGRFVAGSPGPRLTHGLRSATLTEVPELADKMRDIAQAIETELGGVENLTTLKRVAVKEASRLSLIVDSLGDDLLTRGVLTGKGRTRAALQAYGMAFDRLQRLMALLTLERKAVEVRDLAAAFRNGE